jgi:hypothetical protein
VIDEYVEKVILFGYITVSKGNNNWKKNQILFYFTKLNKIFACVFWLGPFLLVIILIIDIRVDALRSLWLFKRPVGFRAQDIGAWLPICRFLTVIAIVVNAFIIGFTSNWSKTRLENNVEFKLFFVIAFEVYILTKSVQRLKLVNELSLSMKIFSTPCFSSGSWSCSSFRTCLARLLSKCSWLLNS